jgi:hypothetical protein
VRIRPGFLRLSSSDVTTSTFPYAARLEPGQRPGDKMRPGQLGTQIAMSRSEFRYF